MTIRFERIILVLVLYFVVGATVRAEETKYAPAAPNVFDRSACVYHTFHGSYLDGACKMAVESRMINAMSQNPDAIRRLTIIGDPKLEALVKEAEFQRQRADAIRIFSQE